MKCSMVMVFWVMMALCGTARVTGAPDPLPNVILIISDDQAWTDYGFMGHPVVKTPHLDRLAEESLLFPRAYVPASLCSPSLATLLSGQYPFQHGITGNDPPRFRDPAGTKKVPDGVYARLRQDMIARVDAMPCLPKLLAEKGYASFQAGKWWLGHHRRGGFTDGMTHGDPEKGGRHGDEGLKIGREGMQPVFDFIDQAGDKPYFLWYAPFLPHAPHNPPQRLLDKYRDQTDSIHVARYWACCEWFDETCGQLLEHVEKRGQTGKTLVMYVTDNGWIQDPDSPRYAPKSKRSPYDGGLRTPIMVKWPGQVRPERVEHPVHSIDIVPTILAACGLSKKEVMPGLNLLDREAVVARQTLFGDIHLHNALAIDDPAKNWTYRWCLRDGWKLIVPNKPNVTLWAGLGAQSDGEVELYRIEDDPHETKNLAETHPEKVEALTKELNDWWNPGA